MSFRFQDLMIDIVPKDIAHVGCYLATACASPTRLCRLPTFKMCPLLTCKGISYVQCEVGTRDITVTIVTCGGTIRCGGSVVDIDRREALDDLAVLKRELHASLEQVEAQEKALQAEGGLQTRAQAEQLEQQLQTALREVQAQKEKLK